jgi:hypothetical protein
VPYVIPAVTSLFIAEECYRICHIKPVATNYLPQTHGQYRYWEALGCPFRIAVVDLEYEFLVSDAVDEIILGADWLADNRCLWDSEGSVLWIRALATPRYVRQENATHPSFVQHIYSKDDVELPPFSQWHAGIQPLSSR